MRDHMTHAPRPQHNPKQRQNTASLTHTSLWTWGSVLLLSTLLLAPVASPLATAALLHALSRTLTTTAAAHSSPAQPANSAPTNPMAAATPRRADDESEILRRRALAALAGERQRRDDRLDPESDARPAPGLTAAAAFVAVTLFAALWSPLRLTAIARPAVGATKARIARVSPFPAALPLPLRAGRAAPASPRAPPLAA